MGSSKVRAPVSATAPSSSSTKVADARLNSEPQYTSPWLARTNGRRKGPSLPPLLGPSSLPKSCAEPAARGRPPASRHRSDDAKTGFKRTKALAGGLQQVAAVSPALSGI